MQFDRIYRRLIAQDILKTFNGQKVAIVAGSFRVPYKYDMDLADQILEVADKIIFDISSVNKTRIDRRPLAKSNLTRLARLISDRDVNGQYDQFIKDHIQVMNYESLKQCLAKMMRVSHDPDLNQKVQEYQEALVKKLYQPLKFYNGAQIKAQDVQRIFKKLFAGQPRVQTRISRQVSPVLDVVNYVSQSMSGKLVMLISLNDQSQRQSSTWKGFKDSFGQDVQVVQYYPIAQPMIQRKQLIQIIDDDEALDYYRSQRDLEAVRSVLANLS